MQYIHFKKTFVGIDFGTSITRIGIEDKGIVLREPSFVGYNMKTNQAIFFGQEAKDIYGKAPEYIKVVKPIENGIISDFDASVVLIAEFLKKAVYPYYSQTFIKKGLAAFTVVPTTSTEVEQKALQEACLKAGFQEAFLIEKPLVAAYGSDLPVFSKSPVFIIDIGGGMIEIAIIIMGGIVKSRVLKLGGDHMDKLIINYLHLKYGLMIGEQTAENLKNELFNLKDKKKVLTVRGKSLENGLPKSVRVTSQDIQEALGTVTNQLIDGIKELIETVPPEIIDGLMKNGITMTGQLSQVEGLSDHIMNEVKIPIQVTANPESSTIRGIMKLFRKPELLKRVIITS